MRTRPAQLPLPFVPPPSSARADLLEDASNAEALAFLDRPNTWPAGRLALHGPPGVGKSHALRAAASAGGWRLLDGAALTPEEALAPVRGTALDDADRAGPVALFAGGVAFGFLGVLLAVPIAATLGVVSRFWLRRYLESPLYLDPPRTGG